MEDDRYTFNEVLAVTRLYWKIRERGDGSSFASSRMLDVSRAYDQLDDNERRQLFLGVWLEQFDPPTAVIAKMRRFLNEQG